MAFVKGQSGNPHGRPKNRLPDGRTLSDVARDFTADAFKVLRTIATDEGAPHPARVSAANAILDRGWGKPAQAVELTGRDGGPIQTQTEILDLSGADEAALRLLAGAKTKARP